MNPSRKHLFWLVTFLCLGALAIFGYKLLVLDFKLSPVSSVQTWEVEAQLKFKGRNKPGTITLRIPPENYHYRIVNEQFISRGFGLNIFKETGNRQAVWSMRRIRGEHDLYYRATVQRKKQRDIKEPNPPSISQPQFEGVQGAAVESILEKVRAHSADIPTFAGEVVKRVSEPSGEVGTLLPPKPVVVDKIKLAVAILAMANIPARPVHGVEVQPVNKNASVKHWLEVYHAGRWLEFNVYAGERNIPLSYFKWWHGDMELFEVSGVSVHGELAVKESTYQYSPFASVVSKSDQPFKQFTFLALPLNTQAVYQVLLMVPVGVFLLVILRNVVGIKTFGTFMPVLIALAFRETQLIWGLVLFTLIVGLGLAVRLYMDYLKLLLVPRLAAVLIVVILLMGGISVVSYQMGVVGGLSIALFPMVILTMIIERMSIVWEERGPGEALQQGAGSLLVATLAYLLMSIDYLQFIIFVYPESLLVLLAFTLLLGRYSGFRLLELRRFRVLAKN